MREEVEKMAIQEQDQFQDIDKIRKRVRELTRPTPKIHFLFYHLRNYLITVNMNKTPEEELLGLGYFSEQVLESGHQNFAKFNNFYISGERRLPRTTVNYSLLHLNYIEDTDI